ncbi:hypothetical protein SFRURICE_007092 [Spodoptera frugiperda]|nr:hypothetical protein SFRURICE_007092 [Spodoptera frugiperda]
MYGKEREALIGTPYKCCGFDRVIYWHICKKCEIDFIWFTCLKVHINLFISKVIERGRKCHTILVVSPLTHVKQRFIGSCTTGNDEE